MNIEKAIEIIQADINDKDVDWDSLLGRAYKLSFEALRRMQDARHHPFLFNVDLLSGETEK